MSEATYMSHRRFRTNGASVSVSPPPFDGPTLLREQRSLLEGASAREIHASLFLRLRLSAQQKLTAQRNQLSDQRSVRHTVAVMSYSPPLSLSSAPRGPLLSVRSDEHDHGTPDAETRHCSGCGFRPTDSSSLARHQSNCREYATHLRLASADAASLSARYSGVVSEANSLAFRAELSAVQQAARRDGSQDFVMDSPVDARQKQQLQKAQQMQQRHLVSPTALEGAANHSTSILYASTPEERRDIRSFFSDTPPSPPMTPPHDQQQHQSYHTPQIRLRSPSLSTAVNPHDDVPASAALRRNPSESGSYSTAAAWVPTGAYGAGGGAGNSDSLKSGAMWNRAESVAARPASAHGPSESPASAHMPAESLTGTCGPSEGPASAHGPAEGPASAHGPAEGPASAHGPAESPASAHGPAESPASAHGPAEGPAADEPLRACPHCGRQFFANSRWPRHVAVCELQKMARPTAKTTSDTRRVYDARARRISESYADEKNLDSGEIIRKVSVTGQTPESCRSSKDDATKETKMRQRWVQLRQALHVSNDEHTTLSSSMASERASGSLKDDRVQCPCCGRRFAQTAAERHIPFCKERHGGPKTMRM